MVPRPRMQIRWDALACDILPKVTDERVPLYRWARDNIKLASQLLRVGKSGIRYAADKRGYTPKSQRERTPPLPKTEGVPQSQARAFVTPPAQRPWQQGRVRDQLEVPHR
jgi:hypothetical protein